MTLPPTTTGSALVEALDADSPTQPGTHAAPEPVRTWGEGWRSVVVGVAGIGCITGLDAAGRDVAGSAPWIVAVVGLVVAGKDAKAIVELVVSVWRGKA